MRLPVRPLSDAPTQVLLELDLTRGLLETPPVSPVAKVQAHHVPVLRAVVEALHKAAADRHVVGLVAHIRGHQPTLAQSSELRDAIAAFRASGKPSVCWTESFGELGPGNVAYHLATAFEEIWLQPSGDVGLTGIAAQAVFVSDALEKVGVRTEIGQRHEYKTAANMFLESSMTEAHREMAERIVESAMETIVADVAASRGLTAAAVRSLVDQAPLTADEALAHGLIDRVGYRDEVYQQLRIRLGEARLRFVTRYNKGLAQLSERAAPVTARSRPTVAVVQAAGNIHLGRSGGRTPWSGPSIGSDSLGAALRAVGSDDDVEAVVLRIDSPGGSYLASDAIRREVLALRRTGRPVIASMASVAGSGGYYIAMPADAVVAGPGTLTGSIGVLAGKLVISRALSRVGVERESVAVGRYAEMFSTQRPFTEDEWQRMEQWLDRVYADFTAKAAQDRAMPVDNLRAVAKGRVWTGADAQRRGLVDELGGLDRAIDVACDRAGIRRGRARVRVLPKQTLLDRLRPPESSDDPAADVVAGGLVSSVLAALGLPGYGVLTMPVTWRLS